jgi:hypothetical protein
MSVSRHMVSAALFLSVLFLPYWFYGSAILVAALLLPFYGEAIILGFLIDTLYGTHVWFPTACVAAGVVVLLIPVRERLRLTV